MATVFHTYDPHFKRDVAVKVLPREFLHDPTFRTRFEREAHILALLEHPAIVPVYDFGQEEDQPYLVMRYMQGGSLAERMQKNALSIAQIAKILHRISSALDRAHSQGIIHRDLKPGNILFDQYGDAFLADFGIARLMAETNATLTGSTIVGTPAYMSPEQIHGDKKADGRSDVYALGIILFEMLTGRMPYYADTPAKMMMMHLLDPVPSILKMKKDLPPGCEVVIGRVMAKQPDERYPTGADLAAAFSGIIHGALSSKQTPPELELQEVIQNVGAMPPEPASLETPSGQTYEAIVCPKCHTPNRSQLRFCSNCNHQLKVECIVCHTTNQVDASHCFHCGANLERARVERQELLEAKRRARAELNRALKEKVARQQDEKLQRLLDDLGNPTNHTFAIYQLNQLGTKAIKALIEVLLNDSNPNVRYGSAKALGQICTGDEVKTLIKARAVKALIRALTDPEPTVRRQVAEALSHFKGQQGQLAVEPLATLINDPQANVRQQARQSLQIIGGKRAQEILDQSKGVLGWFKGS